MPSSSQKPDAYGGPVTGRQFVLPFSYDNKHGVSRVYVLKDISYWNKFVEMVPAQEPPFFKILGSRKLLISPDSKYPPIEM